MNQRSAFSLIELLIAIAVVLILASVIIPLSGTMSERAKMAQSTSNLRQIYAVIMMHAQTNGGILVRGHDYSTNRNWYQISSPLADFLSSGHDLQRLSVSPKNETDRSLRPMDSYGQYVQNDYGYPYACNYYVLTNQRGTYDNNIAPVSMVQLSERGPLVMLTDSVIGSRWGGLGFANAEDSKWSRIATPYGDKTSVLWSDGRVSLQTKEEIKDYIRLY